jgi:hypothetical protein
LVILCQIHKCWGLHEWHLKNPLKGTPFVSWKVFIFLKNQAGLHICWTCWFVDIAKQNILVNIEYHQNVVHHRILHLWHCSNFFYNICVTTPLWDKCEGEAHTPKSGKLESSGTPKNSELDFRGQISLYLTIIYVIWKVLKWRCPKWPLMSHLDICSPSYGQKKGREWTSSRRLQQ